MCQRFINSFPPHESVNKSLNFAKKNFKNRFDSNKNFRNFRLKKGF